MTDQEKALPRCKGKLCWRAPLTKPKEKQWRQPRTEPRSVRSSTPPPSLHLHPHSAAAQKRLLRADAASVIAVVPCAKLPCRCHAPRVPATSQPGTPCQQ